jgi:hypothetical protein
VGLPRPHRAAGAKEKTCGYYDATLEGGWQAPAEPYTSTLLDFQPQAGRAPAFDQCFHDFYINV